MCRASFATSLGECDGQGLLVGHQDAQPARACHGGVQEVPGEHDEVASQEGNHHGGVFAALALVNADGIGERQRLDTRVVVGYATPVEIDE